MVVEEAEVGRRAVVEGIWQSWSAIQHVEEKCVGWLVCDDFDTKIYSGFWGKSFKSLEVIYIFENFWWYVCEFECTSTEEVIILKCGC